MLIVNITLATQYVTVFAGLTGLTELAFYLGMPAACGGIISLICLYEVLAR